MISKSRAPVEQPISFRADRNEEAW